MFKKKTQRVKEAATPDSASRGVAVSPTRQVRELLWWVRESLFELFKLYHHFKWLNLPLKDQFGKKEVRDVMYYHHWFI
jgi:hypothetical protein